MRAIRESFGAKLLSAFLVTVAVPLIVTLAVVRTVTSTQVERFATSTLETADTLFEWRGALTQENVSRLASPFTGGRRAIAALQASLRSGDLTNLAGLVESEILLQDFQNSLIVFTDGEGSPVLSVIGGQRVEAQDPADIRPLAQQLLASDARDLDATGYRVVNDTLYTVWSLYLELGGRPVGVAAFGSPLLDSEVEDVGAVGSFEACLFAAGRCAAASQAVRANAELEAAMVAAAGSVEAVRSTVDGDEWSIRSEPLVTSRPEEGYRIVAVALDPVRAPFVRLQRTVLAGGLAALLLAAFAAALISRGLTRPVRDLVSATGRVAEGDYDTRVEPASRDELGSLATAFNEMTHGLRMREQYRSVLNKVVSQDIADELMKGDVELGGENRNVSVLFADIRGFTPLTEGMEPQAVIRLLNECMEALAVAVDLEGGVVDKFIGDEVMAVFGAPAVQRDHAMRAVSAAVRMRNAIAEMNERRAARGEGAVGVGIGVATGVAVAGNMGSSDRLNYTVLGATVNLAARLTAAAGAGEILVSRDTRHAAGDACIASSLGGRALKGFSSDIEVFAVTGIDRNVTRSARTSIGLPAIRSTPALVALATTLSAAFSPVKAVAQWPTLADAGIGYITSDGRFQADLSGQLDLEGFYMAGDEGGPYGLAVGSGGLFAPRARLFLDLFYGDRLYALVEWRGDRGEAPTADFWEARLEQAFIRLSSRGGALSLQGGIFASPFGSYAQRHLSVIDPFIRPPLPYDHRTVISRRWSPPAEDWFLRWKDNPEEWRVDGAPPVWGVPYQWGAMASATLGIFQFRVAAMNDAPSSEPLDWYEFELIEDEPSWVFGASARLTPELAVGWSYNTGPYVGSDVPNRTETRPECCPGYDQRMWAVDASFARGPLMLRGEFLHDSWEVPNLEEDAVEFGYSAEAQIDLTARWSLAARYGLIDFREYAGVDDWDWDVTRKEVALGYRLALNAGIRATWSWTGNEYYLEPDRDLGAVRLWWAF